MSDVSIKFEARSLVPDDDNNKKDEEEEEKKTKLEEKKKLEKWFGSF